MRLGGERRRVKARHLDHVNLRIPADGADAARTFYGDRLGFGIEDTLYETGEKPFLDARLSATAVVHLWPTDEFEPPTATNFNHFCVVVEESVETIRERLDEKGIEIDDELAAPRGATGEAPSIYVVDPFGYRIELKERV
ncbi:glyoxalase/bleomycin resistance protein/dioxygenase [Halococcus morrhuae DSM 1307]|uniref:Glyoxalase/bleomycin resistance protein/dioxygenase n=1 Tax=Halococcus morrhuae DSM 1307 TaxID=931277 RepID=M0MU62_HALMO|nr:glyoxalase/bleomycin resistance protein/dioxygenase [Halococcus morrhuae DSM 1307]